MSTIALQTRRGGVGANLPGAALCRGRYEIVPASVDPDLFFVGSDPYGTPDFTGLIVPAVASDNIAGSPRYLFMLARAQFQDAQKGVALVGIRLYADIVARVPNDGSPPFVFHRQITSPMWHPPDGNISWHVMVIDKTWRDTRNPANGDSFIYQDSYSPALLYQVPGPYAPPNGGRPWGTPLDASLGNIHDLRYPWRSAQVERELYIPIPTPCDIALFASVRQNDPTTNPTGNDLSANQFAALEHEDQFLVAFSTLAQYGRIAGTLVFQGDSWQEGSR